MLESSLEIREYRFFSDILFSVFFLVLCVCARSLTKLFFHPSGIQFTEKVMEFIFVETNQYKFVRSPSKRDLDARN